MNANKTFWLGEEDTLQPEDIGAIVAIDTYYGRSFMADAESTALDAISYFGTLAGFSEHRGVAKYRRIDLGDQLHPNGIYSHREHPDMVIHGEKYEVAIFFADGRRVTIKDDDWARITVYGRRES